MRGPSSSVCGDNDAEGEEQPDAVGGGARDDRTPRANAASSLQTTHTTTLNALTDALLPGRATLPTLAGPYNSRPFTSNLSIQLHQKTKCLACPCHHGDELNHIISLAKPPGMDLRDKLGETRGLEHTPRGQRSSITC